MPIITPCTAPGCETLTLGPLCLEHDQPTTRVFVRGRPAPTRFRPTFSSASLEDVLTAEFRRVSERQPAVLVRR